MRKNKKNMPEQPSLTPEQIQMLNARMEQTGEDRSKLEPHDMSTRAQAMRYAKKHKLHTGVIIVTAVSAVLVVVLLAVYFILSFPGREDRSDFTVIVGSTKPQTVKYDSLVKDGELHLDMEWIASLCNMTVSGSAKKAKYTVSDAQYLKFENESDTAIINGKSVEMNGKSYITAGGCLVPYKFVSKAIVSGVIIKFDTQNHKITLERVTESEKSNEIIYAEVMFSADAFKASQGFLDTGKDDNENYRYYYNIDVSNYLEFIDPADASEYLMLVNKTVMLGRDYVPSDLTTITKNVSPMHSADYYQMRSCAVQALYAMLDSMIADGVTDIYVSSTYRSYERQEYLFNYYLQRENGDEEAVLKYSARPGTSEHQSGLCLDFTTASIDYGVLNVFENTDAFDWLSKNAYKFGFILRYPSDKVDITGYTYEPWHYRFVGRTAATEIYNSGICFEEYIATLNK